MMADPQSRIVHAISIPAARIGVTGATGFVGAAIVDRLLGMGAAVRVLVRNPARLDISGTLDIVQGSLGDNRALEPFSHGLDALIHCAGLTHARTKQAFFETNVEGAAQIAAAFSAQHTHQNPGARFVHISSLAARVPDISAYARSKAASETAVATACSSPVVTVRAPALFGPRDHATLPFFRAVKRGLAPIPGGARETRASILYVGDFVEAVIACLTLSLTAPVSLFEVGDAKPDGHSWPEIAEACGKAFGRRPRLVRLPRMVLTGHSVLNSFVQKGLGRAPMLTPEKIDEFFYPDWAARDNLLSTHADWRPAVPLDEGFRRTADWYRQAGWL